MKNLLDEQVGADLQEIKKGIAILFEPGQVVEVRVPRDKFGVIAGYFDDQDRLAETIKKLSDSRRYEGIYYSLNVCKKALLARYGKNNLREGAKTTTSDKDIERRRWLLFDFDPVRPKDISSTNEERKAAGEIAATVIRWLKSLGWPEPILARSGNGYHLLYRVDEPNDQQTTQLFTKCVGVVHQKFTTNEVEVDKTVFNAARVVKAYGSLACKGEDTDERPHRFSKILRVPASLGTVNHSLLEALANAVTHDKSSIQKTEYAGQGSSVTAGKVQEFLNWGGIAVRSGGDYEGGTRWILKECFFDSQHNRGEVCVIQYSNGALKYNCFHQSCCENRWEEFRSAVEKAKGERFHFIESSDYSRSGKVARLCEPRAQQDVQLITSIPWPHPATKAAFRGLAGDFVRLIEPHSEADPVALLAQLLVAFGSVMGRNPYFRVESDFHYPNLNCALVGPTSKGRKGSSWGHVKRLFEAVDSYWAGKCILSGMSSGEGLIHAVRDAVMHPQQTRRGSSPDMGVEDKRLMVVESEFAQPLKLMTREGNILSTVIRQAWDSGDLYTLSKNTPARATGAHISIIGHITQDELRRYLNQTEQANGFGNRFLWFCVKRSKSLPEGGAVPEEQFEHLVQRFASALEFAQGVQQMERDEGARVLWNAEYASLSEGRPGMLGAVTGRAEAQVVRLSMLYALLDCSAVIRPEHLLAALALWNYSEESARYIFGGVVGDPTRDAILKALHRSRGGMTRTEISNLFAGHQAAVEITRALAALESNGLASRQLKATEGRSQECWSAVGVGSRWLS